MLLFCVVPEILQTRPGQRDATGGDGGESDNFRNIDIQTMDVHTLSQCFSASIKKVPPEVVTDAGDPEFLHTIPTSLRGCSKAVSSLSPALPGSPLVPYLARLEKQKRQRQRQ